MANTLQLKNDIKKLKLGLKSKGLSASIKDKLKTQLTKVENELKSAQAGAPPRKVSTTKSTKDALDSLKQLIKKKGYGVYQNAGVDLKKDAQEGALATGRRVSKGLKGNQYGDKASSKGHVYYEYRANRLDVKQPKGKQKYPKLAEGGYMAKGGETQGYDDREDERLAMEYGKMASKDLNTTHARRDDARFEERGKMAKGGDLSSIKKEYEENEDENMHSENVVLLAKHFGNKEDLAEAKTILSLHEKEGHLSSENGKKRSELHLKLINKARAEMSKEGIEFAKGGKLIGKQKNLDVNENGKLDAEDFKMLRKQRMAEGGVTEKEVVDSNAQMVLSQIKAVKHHADELSQVVSRNSDIEAWVVAKIERASTDLSDITHYLDGQHEKMSMGGSVYHHAHKMDKK